MRKRNIKIHGSKFDTYIKIFGDYVKPAFFFRKRLENLLDINNDPEKEYLMDRVNYYNKVEGDFSLSDSARSLKDFRVTKQAMYFYDIQHLLKYFPDDRRCDVLFGDITHVPERPTLVKSRPIAGENQNSVLEKLNSTRHFYFVKDIVPFSEKKNKLVWRGKAELNPLRVNFLENFFDHRLCDVGSYPAIKLPQYGRGFMSISQQLEYKFILSLEGNDVATNLKWIAASNSLCFMPKPCFETWFMEGRLLADVHYVEIRDDFSDLEEKLTYFINNPEHAISIINNANEFVSQFQDAEKELKLQLLVLNKYFRQVDKYATPNYF